MIEVLRLGAMSNEVGDGRVSLWVLVLVGALALLIIWNLAAYVRRGVAAKNLFLAVRFDGPRRGSRTAGHLTALAPQGAVMVTDAAVAKGEHLRLDLGSLPGYPDAGGVVTGVVTSVKSFGSSQVVRMRFEANPAPRTLRRYLETLTDGLTRA